MFEKVDLIETFTELVRRASTQLPEDIIEAIRVGRDLEEDNSLAQKALDTILTNINLADELSSPLCQDTGTPVVWIKYPVGVSTRKLKKDFTESVRQATGLKYLRPNAVDTLSGRNTGNGTGRAIPNIHFEEWDGPGLEVRIILKGGGSENVGEQYKLPDTGLEAGRDLEGVRRVVLDAVVQAQGKGCAPGVLAICIGGDRVSSYEHSKEQLLRPLKDRNENPELAELEDRLLVEANQLGIGPMGFGGKTTVLGVKIGFLDRLPASYFVTVTYMCWADRRATVRIDEEGGLTWLS